MSYTVPDRSRGFTIFELIMVMIIIAVLAVLGGFLMSRFMQQAVFIPSQMAMDMIVSDALDVMINGDEQAAGLRYSRQITRAGARRVFFINQDGYEIRYRFQPARDRVQRRIMDGPNAGGWIEFPNYVPNGVDIAAPGNRIFIYYDANETTTGNAANVRRVAISLIARTGSGNFDEWDGQAARTSSVTVRRNP